MKVAIYARVSTDEQTTDNQMPDLLQFASDKKWDITETYAENESSWKAGHQHELSRLLKDLRSGKRKYDVVLIWSLDRLSRQGIGPLLQMVHSFEVLNCHVVSVKETWLHETTGPTRELLMAVFGWIAKWESDRRSDRTKAGLQRATSQGKHLGRPKGSKDDPEKPRRRSGYLLRYAGRK